MIMLRQRVALVRLLSAKLRGSGLGLGVSYGFCTLLSSLISMLFYVPTAAAMPGKKAKEAAKALQQMALPFVKGAEAENS